VIWEDKSGNASLDDVRQRLTEFKSAENFSSIHPKSIYWTAQRLRNSLGEDRDIVVNAAINREGIHWLRYQHFVIDANGQAKELNGPYSTHVPLHMNDINPSVFTMDTSLSRNPVFTLPKNEEVLLLSRLSSNSTFTATNFNLQLYDRATYLELRKLGLYIEGLFAGIILALVMSSCSSLFFKRDIVSVIYTTWLFLGFLQIIVLPIQDGQRLFELVFDQQPSTIGIMPSHVFWMGLISYLQLVMYFGFGRAFLGTQRYFPRFHFSAIFSSLLKDCVLSLLTSLSMRSVQFFSDGLRMFFHLHADRYDLLRCHAIQTRLANRQVFNRICDKRIAFVVFIPHEHGRRPPAQKLDRFQFNPAAQRHLCIAGHRYFARGLGVPLFNPRQNTRN